MEARFVTIARFPDPLEAQIACGRLQAEGIAAHLADVHTNLANWEWRLAVGGARVLVDEDEAEHALRVLRELDAGGYALEAEDEAAQALRAPYRESPSSRLAWIAFILFGLPLPWRRRPLRDDEAVREA